MYRHANITAAVIISLASYANSTIQDYAFTDDLMQAETVGNRNDMVKLVRALKRVALKTKNNQSIVETTSKFEDSSIRLFMVCDFTNWEPNCKKRGDCKRSQCKEFC